MKHPLRTLAVVSAAAVTLTLAGGLPASAITGGQPDGAGHPNVALIVFYDSADSQRYRCSATLGDVPPGHGVDPP